MLENGRDKDEMIPEADNHTGITAKISKKFEIDFELLNFKYLEIPINPPTLQKNIPTIKVKCGGLNNPSKPK